MNVVLKQTRRLHCLLAIEPNSASKISFFEISLLIVYARQQNLLWISCNRLVFRGTIYRNLHSIHNMNKWKTFCHLLFCQSLKIVLRRSLTKAIWLVSFVSKINECTRKFQKITVHLLRPDIHYPNEMANLLRLY